MRELRLLVLADVHFARSSEVPSTEHPADADLGAELAQRAIVDACRRGGFDALVLLGDLLAAGDAPGAERDLAELEEALHRQGKDVPRIVVPGNHDGAPELLLSIFNDQPGLHEVNGCGLYSFVDRWDEHDVGHRALRDMERFAEIARSCTGGPLVVLQHNPLYPPIDSDYPYVLGQAHQVMAAYSTSGVSLSLSGHCHDGQPLSQGAGVAYYTCPALIKPPFRYAVVTLGAAGPVVCEHSLRLPQSPVLVDVHTHTQYAYCGEDITAPKVIRRARVFGLGGVCLTEHADQLYLTREEHASGYVYEHADYWPRPRSCESDRMPCYRRDVEPLRSDFVGAGLELELDAAWRAAARPSDLNGWDLLLGGVHWIPGKTPGGGHRRINQAFMRNARALLEAGARVLAHPFRFYIRNGLEPPRELYAPLAQMLAEYDAAAEINFHTNRPDSEFFAACIDRGVRIALGSDAHNLLEVGDFHPHLDLLGSLAGTEQIASLLYVPPIGTGPGAPSSPTGA